MITDTIIDLKKNYRLYSECEKNILRYNEIINKHSRVNKNVYTKLEIHTNKLNELTKEIEEYENYLLESINYIIKSINNYVTNSPTNYYIEVAERYNKLKSSKIIEKTIIEEELSNQIKNLYDKETKIKSEIKLLNEKSKKLKYLLDSLLKYQNESIVDELSILIVIEQIKNDIKNTDEILINLNNELKEVSKNICNLDRDELLITTNLNIIELTLQNVFYYCEHIRFRDFHNNSIPLLKNNKEFDKNQFVNGKYFLKNYIENYYPNYLDNYHKYLNHIEILNLVNKNRE